MPMLSQQEKSERAKEIRWGEEQEDDLFRQWRRLSKYARHGSLVLRSKPGAAWDRMLLSKEGLPLCYVELKVRRSEWGMYGEDVIFPLTKHKFAIRLQKYNLAFIGVTRYSCGNIVEVHLGDEPHEFLDISRRDRSTGPVPHVRYTEGALTVFPPTR